MRLSSKKILGISITTAPKKEILEYLKKCLKSPSKIDPKSPIIVTPNPEQVVYATKHPRFADILNEADIAIPDGIGLVWGDRFLYPKPHIKRITGVELTDDLVALAAKEHVPVGLIGGRGGVAVKAFECLQQKYPRVRGWAIEPPELGDGMQKEYLESVARKIRETKAQMVFVGLGAPKQEYFIEKLQLSLRALAKQSLKIASPFERARDDSKPVLLMSVGGAFDEMSGRLPTPPKFIDRYGFKWFWRLIVEPWRWRRQRALLEFIWLVMKEKFI